MMIRQTEQENYTEVSKMFNALISTSFNFNDVPTEVYVKLLEHGYVQLHDFYRELTTIKKVICHQLKEGVKPKDSTILEVIRTLLEEAYIAE